MYNSTLILKPTVDKVTGMKDYGLEKYSNWKGFGMDKVTRKIRFSITFC